ncbi:hypothetical protein OCGS_0413 [Oceaniovalibus guishaninsula JLT2003]|uniref:Response regulatory domain-containing protein n=1 Tax=Oceaniovalibus guishaninsula JLT2003 TaxID=1231392 RepID=K2HD11_9RHOB|nr:response regulator [Oceaniovalibus guishaninsula]EKE45323.1 hypothetical protein OCGS_0413 [Oceaniovalibus guishaninsula JLT2003]
MPDRTLRILIVEDEALIALDLEWQMRDEGYEVVGIAATEAQAVELARAKAPDLALMDLHLARNGCGLKAARQLRCDPGIPCIIISASLAEVADSDITAIRPLAMLSKPIIPSELLDAVSKVGSVA